jgi:hypothetical protein
MSAAMCHTWLVEKSVIPDYIPISPITLACPRCPAKPGEDCQKPAGGHIPFVHLARIKAAAKLDISTKKKIQ